MLSTDTSTQSLQNRCSGKLTIPSPPGYGSIRSKQRYVWPGNSPIRDFPRYRLNGSRRNITIEEAQKKQDGARQKDIDNALFRLTTAVHFDDAAPVVTGAYQRMLVLFALLDPAVAAEATFDPNNLDASEKWVGNQLESMEFSGVLVQNVLNGPLFGNWTVQDFLKAMATLNGQSLYTPPYEPIACKDMLKKLIKIAQSEEQDVNALIVTENKLRQAREKLAASASGG